MFRPLKPYQLTIDIVFAALCVLIRTTLGYEDVIAIFVVLGMGTALALRRLSPGLALGVAWFVVTVQMFGNGNPDLANFAILPVLFATAAYGTNLVKWLGLISSGVGALVGTLYIVIGRFFYGNGSVGLDAVYDLVRQLPAAVSIGLVGFFSALAVLGLSWTLGLLVRTRRTARQSRAAQAAAEAEHADAEREVGIEQERTRIARDMHDVVAHSLAVVIAQADGARYARHSDPDAVDEALTTIAGTAREALGDVRLLLGQLRHSQGEAPRPVLADLERLIEQMRASGLIVTREEFGDPLLVGTGQQLAVYRIVQEALTNALRHGDKSKDVVVRFDWTPDVLRVSVRNTIRIATGEIPSRAGHGLDGMRERAVLSGGTLVAESTGDEFVVTAVLPIQAATAQMAIVTGIGRPSEFPPPAPETAVNPYLAAGYAAPTAVYRPLGTYPDPETTGSATMTYPTQTAAGEQAAVDDQTGGTR